MHIPVVKGDLGPDPPKHAQGKKDAPYISGEIDLGDRTVPVHLLIDTGADCTMLNGALLGDARNFYETGEAGVCHGVGGQWPVRDFKSLRLVILTDTKEEVAIELPRVKITAPYRLRQRRLRKPRALWFRPGQSLGDGEKCENPHLLGRDVFLKNRLRLVWDPESPSRIDFIQAPAPEAAPASAVQAPAPIGGAGGA